MCLRLTRGARSGSGSPRERAPFARWGAVGALALILIACAAPASAGAQEFRATITGRVTDSAGLAMPGVTVSATNVQTNEVASAVTNPDGVYSLPFLRPGLYKLSAEIEGFRKHEQQLQLEVGQSQTINITMQVGAVTETVTVAAQAAALDNEKADRGEVIDNKRIAELPLQARNPFSLSVLVAGVNYNAQAIYLRPFDNGALADWSMNGGANRNNEFLLDGAPNNANQGGNNIAYVPPAEAVQEFKISTNSYDAQYGRTAGGVVNVSLKSGTNTLHGVGYEFYRRNWLDANSFLLNSRNAPKSSHYLDQYGVSLDGPVVIPGVYNGRNKTFFLFTGERYREGTPAPLFGTTPTQAMRNGDFSDYRDAAGNLITIYDPRTGRLVNTQWVRDPFPGNIIPPDRISPIAKNILSYYPLPNNVTPGVPSWQQNLAYPDHFDKDVFWNWVTKIDHNITEADRVFFHWAENNRQENRDTNPLRSGPAQDGQLPLIRANRNLVGDWVHVFHNGSLLFNMRSSYTYYDELSRSDYALGFDPTTLGLPANPFAQLPVKLFPRIDMNDYISLSRGANDNLNYIYTLQPNVSMTRGRHNVRSGLDLRYTHVAGRTIGNAGGQIGFSRVFTQKDFSRGDPLSGSSLASMLLGAPSSGSIDNNVLPDFRWTFAAPWVQDDWKITDKLTLNLGFRWDFNSPVSEDQNRLNYIFDPTIVNPVTSRINQAQFPGYVVNGGLTFVGVNGNPTTPWKYDKSNYQIRLGTAYQLNEHTVLRAGYGKYFLNPTGQGFQQGFSLQTPLIASDDGNRTPLYNLANPFPSGLLQPPGSSLGPLTFLGRGLSYSNPDFVVPYVHQFSVGLQRELPWGIVLEASYVGSRSRHQQDQFTGVNEPSRALQDLCDVTKGGDPAYCNAPLPNPFFGVPGFEGTGRFTSATLSRFELSRPFPAFGGGITQTERNDGKIDYDSLQFVGNKRLHQGITVNATYTYVPRFDVVGSTAGTLPDPGGGALNGFIDNVTRTLNVSPYFTHRVHRITASGVWEFPFGQNKTGVPGALMKGWSVAPMFVYQSGQPWLLPGNIEIIGDPTLDVKKTGQFIYGIAPCVAQRAADGSYQLLGVAVAYGCKAPTMLVREPFQSRTTMFWDDRFRRPGYWQLDLNFAKTTQITEHTRFQIRLEAFNVFNSPMYDERDFNRDTNSADFGRINRNTTGQSNFQRFIQLGFRFIF
jgi:hypothetical protein